MLWVSGRTVVHLTCSSPLFGLVAYIQFAQLKIGMICDLLGKRGVQEDTPRSRYYVGSKSRQLLTIIIGSAAWSINRGHTVRHVLRAISRLALRFRGRDALFKRNPQIRRPWCLSPFGLARAKVTECSH